MRSSKSRSRSKSNRSRSVGNIVNRVFDSSGPEGKVRGTPQQIIEKYTQLARDATLANDRVAAENFQQHAEHYTRMLGDAQREMDARRDQDGGQNGQNGQNGQQNGQQGGQNNGHQTRARDGEGDSAPQPRAESRPDQRDPRPEHRDPRPERPADSLADSAPDSLQNGGSDALATDGSDSGLVETPEDNPQPKPRRPRTRKPRAPKAEADGGKPGPDVPEAAE